MLLGLEVLLLLCLEGRPVLAPVLLLGLAVLEVLLVLPLMALPWELLEPWLLCWLRAARISCSAAIAAAAAGARAALYVLDPLAAADKDTAEPFARAGAPDGWSKLP